MTDRSAAVADPTEVLGADPELAPHLEEHGLPTVEAHDEPFERVITTIVNQQLSVESAAAIRGRLFDQFDITPDGILAADEDGLREVGLSTQKIRYVRNIAEAWDDTFDPALYTDTPGDEVVDAVTEVTGIGDWTAKIYLMFVLGREDVYPVEDLGIRRAMTELYGYEDRAEMVEHAEAWRPYRTHASILLWRAIE